VTAARVRLTSTEGWGALIIIETFPAADPYGLVILLSGLFSALLVCHIRRMRPPFTNLYMNHRFPPEIISHSVGCISASASATATSKNCYVYQA
jgi:hypothetical protein